jgi:hypothetical protein
MNAYCNCRDKSRSRFQVAVDLQDACNLRAIARELVRAADEAAEEGGTGFSYRDAAVILIVNKIESLVHSNEGFPLAYDHCHKMINAAHDAEYAAKNVL